MMSLSSVAQFFHSTLKMHTIVTLSFSIVSCFLVKVHLFLSFFLYYVTWKADISRLTSPNFLVDLLSASW